MVRFEKIAKYVYGISMKLDELARYLLNKKGLYLLGAGASAGVVPFGKQLAEKIGDTYKNGGSFPVDTPHQDVRTNWAINLSLKDPLDLMIRGDELHNDLIRRMPSGFVQALLFHELAKPSFLNATPNNYSVFEYFPSSVVVNYNLDGLAQKFCKQRHHIIAPHGTISSTCGSREFGSYIEATRDWDIAAIPTAHILIEPEPITIYSQLPANIDGHEFVAVIGYTFGRNAIGFDDCHSLTYLCELLRLNPKPVFVVDPYPECVTETLKEKIKSNDVYGVPILWNVYAEAMIRSKNNKDSNKIDRNYSMLLDSGKFG